jgi:outer membrane protein assembly factor BamB
MSRIAVTITVSLCLTISAHAQNWPTFRGPNGSGIADARPLPVNWDAEKSINILWKTAIPGLGHSSPAIWGEQIFLTAAESSAKQLVFNAKDEDTQPANDTSVHQWRVYSLDKRSGKVLWSRTAHQGVPKVKRHIKASQANATPVTNGHIVVVSFGSEGLYTYDLDGKLLWKQDLGILDPGYAGQPDLSWGFASSPIIHDNLVILQCDIQKDSFIVAFNIADGKRAWLTKREEKPSCSRHNSLPVSGS